MGLKALLGVIDQADFTSWLIGRGFSDTVEEISLVVSVDLCQHSTTRSVDVRLHWLTNNAKIKMAGDLVTLLLEPIAIVASPIPTGNLASMAREGYISPRLFTSHRFDPTIDICWPEMGKPKWDEGA
jgi:hypothetical protein